MVKNGLPAIHPGEYLAEILEGLYISQTAFARAIGVSPMRITYVVKGMRPITAAFALRFGKAFDQSPEYWLNLQSAYDLKTTAVTMGERLFSVHSLAHA